MICHRCKRRVIWVRWSDLFGRVWAAFGNTDGTLHRCEEASRSRG